jgi:GntR family transcriptional repressor for pyruvate dehydrogenase complex
VRELRRAHLYEAVAEEIRRFIVDQRLQPGDGLPSERELCQQLGVGRTSLREGLRLLQTIGVVEIKSGLGTFVSGREGDVVLARASEVALPAADLIDVAEVREVLEVRAVELAAERRTDEHLERLRDQLARDREKVEDGTYDVEDDLDFHRSVFEASGNRVLIRFVSTIGDLMASVRRARLARPGRDAQTLAEHTAIYEAVRDRRPNLAARLMHEQVHDTNLLVFEMLGRQQPTHRAVDPDHQAVATRRPEDPP